MNSSLVLDPTLWSFGFAALVFAAFSLRLAIGWRGGLRAKIVLVAGIASTLWAIALMVATGLEQKEWWLTATAIDMCRIGAWMAFLLYLSGEWAPDGGGRLANLRSRWVLGTGALLALAILLPSDPPWQPPIRDAGVPTGFIVRVAISVLGLALIEQLYRRTPEDRMWAIKPLIIGLAGMFAFDLFMYAEAVLFRYLDPGMRAARGVTHAFAVFFVAIATARNTAWTIDLHVSRGLVFQSTAVLIAGVCLLIVAAAGYWVRIFGGGWGATLQITFVFAAMMCLAALSLSGRLRSRLRVFINKNLFSYRYDYRKEWLSFTEVLGTSESVEKLHERVVQSIANLVESGGGAIWLERGNAYCQVSCVNLPAINETEPLSSKFSVFMQRTGWVLQLDEVRSFPERFADLALPSWLTQLENAWLVVPLPNGATTIGFVVLARPLSPVDIDWEVRDLLKTASRQAAGYLAQFRAHEALLEAEKFNAFNRMSAFVVHDLKNLISQLALLLKNAERHRDNPEFQRDMLETIEHVVQRMTHLTQQLHTGSAPASQPRLVELQEVLQRIVTAKHHCAVPVDIESASSLRAFAHEEQIERVIGHIVQNAIDATDKGDQHVKVRIYAERGFAVVEVVDRGIGMSEDFIRDRLFRPFQTTKESGMGVGMNESFHYLNGIGGRIHVESAVGAGSCFRVYLRLAAEPIAAGLK